MPGLSQLKKFNSDVLSLGNESTLRAARGEKPVIVPIPRTILDKDDSDDFVLGMPENPDADAVADEEAKNSGEDDLSDITGTGAQKASSAAPAGPVPDLSGLLHPISEAPASASEENVPDLSMFDESPAEEETPEEEVEQQPPSIADLSLDDLLASGGFDADAAAKAQEEELAAASAKEAEERKLAEEAQKKEKTPGRTEAKTAGIPRHEIPVQRSSEPGAPLWSVPPEPAAQPAFENENISAGLSGTPNKETPAAAENNESYELPDNFEIPEVPETLESSEVPESSVPEENFGSAAAIQSASASAEKTNDVPVDDFDYTGNAIDLNAGLPDEIAETDVGKGEETVSEEKTEKGSDEISVEDISEKPLPAENVSEENAASDAEKQASEKDSFDPSTFDFNLDSGEENAGEAAPLPEDNAPIEKFDTSGMEGMDFSIPDTDSQIAENAEEKTDFELGKTDEFKSENGDFEIPGFSDISTVPDKKGKVVVATPDFTGALEGDKAPRNTLTDDQYKRFLENLSDYPLNVRVAVEELIVKNEFTDDAEFEVIEKILAKAPVRQVASYLEKMLDISLPVPRDFERRTAAEYAAYKESFQYQLKNKFIPAVIIGVAGLLLCIGLFQFGKNFIWKPAKASNLYRQGYAALEADEYPQSEIKFNEALKYQYQKKWFYKYARGYRIHKQYDRAVQMYKNILFDFNFDKQAGIEYAQMEYQDLQNYTEAERVAKRAVLDHHINDKDGILLLGDIYLDWATEKDPAKFEAARTQYSNLIQLYGQKNLYLSRMMRYFIRTDNLREVLQMKEHFMPSAKSLEAADWTELSGYLLDKLYGPLAPADEYLRGKIEDVKELLLRAVKADRKNPIALYNLSRYYVKTNNGTYAKESLEQTIDAFKKAVSLKPRDTYKEIDSYRLLGEQYTKEREYLKAEEIYTGGLSIWTDEHDTSGFESTPQIGELYADAADIDYFISGDLETALLRYTTSVDMKNDTPSIRYRIGYIYYGKNDYMNALGSFMKASEDNPEDNNLLLAMGNTLALNADNYASEGYYERLLSSLDVEKQQKGILFPQVHPKDADIVDLYLKASNNLGVTLYRLARRTGSSSKNAEAMVQFSQSMRAWDALTRNPETLIRLPGSNLAEQNMKYASHPVPQYEPAIYTELPHMLTGEEGLTQ